MLRLQGALEPASTKAPLFHAASDLINVMSDVTDACSVLYLKGGSCFCSLCLRLSMYAHERARRCALPALGFPPMPEQRHTTNYKQLWKDFFSFLTKAVLTKVVLLPKLNQAVTESGQKVKNIVLFFSLFM